MVSKISSRRSTRLFGANIGYKTTFPSLWKLTQLFGKIESGECGSKVSLTVITLIPFERSFSTK